MTIVFGQINAPQSLAIVRTNHQSQLLGLFDGVLLLKPHELFDIVTAVLLLKDAI